MAYTTKQIGIETAYLCEKTEEIAAAAFHPGHILEYDSNGKFQKHSTAGGPVAPVIVAMEDTLQGNGVTNAYAANNNAYGWMCKPGALVNIRVKDGETIAIGDFVESAGDGTIQKHVTDTFSGAEAVTIRDQQIIGQARSACDMSDSSAADPSPPFCAVRIR